MKIACANLLLAMNEFFKFIKITTFIFFSLIIAGCDNNRQSRMDVDAAALAVDPNTLDLEQGSISYAKRSILPSGIEAGIITLGNGEQVKYWFKSHHLGKDIGSTRFEFSDGSIKYLDGWFCCEVLLPDVQIANRRELEMFINSHNGKSP